MYDRLSRTLDSTGNEKKTITWPDTIEKAKIVIELLKLGIDIDGWDHPGYKQSSNMLINTINRACWKPNRKFLKNILNKENYKYTYIFILAGRIHFKIFSQMLNTEIYKINSKNMYNFIQLNNTYT